MIELAILGNSTSSAANWENFLTILLLVFGLFLVLAGLFTAYFGSGKSRTIGVALLVFGFVVGIAVWALWHQSWGTSNGSVGLFTVVEQSVLVIVAALIGALVAIGIFLVAIMKS